MEAIQMVDLKRQYQRIKPEVDAAIAEVLESAAFINGPAVGTFASGLARYLGVKHVIPCANGTDALQISLMALGLKPGDEVIVPSYTFVATAEVVALLSLQPVFVEVDDQTFTMDPASVEKAITPATKAIIPVHLYGHSAPMQEILTIATENKIPVIEDTAQAMGGDYIFPNGTRKKNGTMGQIGCTSFFPSKNLGCYGDSGAIFTNDDALFDRLSMIANHGQKKRYLHEIVGCNSRMDTLQAAVLNIKLKHLDEYCRARRTAADYYDRAFRDHPLINIPFRAAYTRHVFHQYTVQLDAEIDRDRVKQQLAEAGIPSMIYYPVPCHRQEMFAGLHAETTALPVTDRLTGCVLSLPMHTELDPQTLEFITDTLKEVVHRPEAKNK